MKTFETPAGKRIQLKICPTTAHIKVEFSTGGELPMELSGLYTTEREAEISILKYLAKQKRNQLKIINNYVKSNF